MLDESERALLALLPAFLLRQAAEGVALEHWERRFPAAVLMADISGFTPLAETLARSGRRGVEELSALLDKHFSRMMDLVHAYGGDVVQFGGDAITALFDLAAGESLSTAVLAAAACGLAIQRHIAATGALRTSQGDFPLQVRIGVGAGPALMAVVGSRPAGLRYLLAGPARQGAVRAQRLAHPGEVVLNRTAHHSVQHRVAAVATRWGYALVITCPEPPPAAPRPAAPPLSPASWAELAAFLAPALGQRIRASGRAFLGEHRHAVVLFVGFRGLDFERDPAVADKVRAYVTAMQEVMARYDAYLAEIEIADKGSLLLVLLGVPSAHEDDEERAVLCALAMQARVRQPDLAGVAGQRVGVSAGPLFVGGIGGKDRWTYAVVGDEVNLASRLMEQAEWGQVVVSSRVRLRAGERGRFVPLGEVALKGKARPVPAFVVAGLRERSTMLAERALLYRGETVGREAEVAWMRAVGQRAAGGQAQVLVIEGEAGMGKSRLAADLARWWLDHGYQGYSGDCFSYTMGTPYQPWSELLHALLDLPPEQPAGARLQRAEGFLSRIDPAAAARLPLLADLLGLPAADNAVTRSLEGAERKRALFHLVLEILRHVACTVPLLLLLEDIHWSDMPSLELLEHVVRNMAGFPVLVVLPHRPLGEPPPAPYRRLSGLPCSQRLVLDALPAASSQALALARLGLAPGACLPARMQALLTPAQGNPFFVEEILNTLHDAGVQVVPRDGGCAVLGDLDAVEIPATVQALVQSRLDRLEEGLQLTLKVAAVVGRTVPYATLRAIHPLGPGELDAHLAALERVDLLRLERLAAGPTFFFKHVITQQVAYESLLFAQRQALHEALGQHLEAAHAHDLDEVVDLLAHHYAMGGNRPKAFAYLIRAGERATRAYTHQEALGYYRRARAWLEEGNLAQRWDLLCRLERALNAMGQREEQRWALEEMEALAQQLGGGQRLAVVRWRQGTLLSQTGQPEEGIRVLREAAAVAEHAGDLSTAGQCAIDISRAYWLLCRVDQSQGALAQARHLFQQAGDRAREAAVFNMLGNISLAMLARYEQALEMFRQEGQICRQLGDEHGESTSSLNQAIALISLGQARDALERIAPVLSFYERSGNPRFVGVALFAMGHALLRLGRWADALTAAHRSIAMLEECEERNFLIEGEGLAGRILLEQGHVHRSLEHFERACALAQAGGQEVDWAHYRSWEALVLLQLGRAEEALVGSAEAIAILERQSHRVDNAQYMLWHHFQIVRARHGPAVARPYLERAYGVVQEIAAEILDPELRRSFLEHIAVNRKIVGAWQDAQATSS